MIAQIRYRLGLDRDFILVYNDNKFQFHFKILKITIGYKNLLHLAEELTSGGVL
jgi:hypothetical protein